jgi:hypothetical protein
VPDYAEARKANFAAAATTQMVGVRVNVADDQALFSGYTPIQRCWCVTEPCKCSGPIVWIPTDDIYGETETERRNDAGEQLREFQIDADAAVLIESIRRVKLSSSSREATVLNKSCGCGVAVQSDRPGVSGVYVGQGCGGGTLYDIYSSSYKGESIEVYVAVGSC